MAQEPGTSLTSVHRQAEAPLEVDFGGNDMLGFVRRATVLALVLGPVALGGSMPAHADRPAVDKRSCHEAGGAFTKQKGTRTCTQVAQERRVGPVLTSSVRVEGGPRTGPTVDLIGTYRVVRVVETTTTSSQRGNDPVVTTSVERELSSTVERLTCRRALADAPEPRPTVDDSIASCASAGVYPT